MSKRSKSRSRFRLFAVRPLAGCKSELLKVLKENQIYYFYNDFVIGNDDQISHTTSYPECLYDFRKTQLNISAIAGKNGSGKSTLVDIVFMAINNIACHFNIKEDLVTVQGLRVELFLQLDGYLKITIDGPKVKVETYSTEGEVIKKVAGEQTNYSLKDLFYTIGMNYSHYAYNSKDYTGPEQEDWLAALFHKNDAYQTPLVLNPWRDNGDIVINRENDLVRSRLIANLIRPTERYGHDFRNITENLRATALTLQVNRKKIIESELYSKQIIRPDKREETVKVAYQNLDKLDKEKILSRINKEYNFNYDRYQKEAEDLERLAMDYLIRKLITISIKYEEYRDNFLMTEDDFDYKKLPNFIYRLTRDRSHIAFKFRQTLNYLKHNHIRYDKGVLNLDELSQEIQNVIAKKQSHKDRPIELLPPPIFSTDIILQPLQGNQKEISFHSLSSGEKQMIYSVSSILYHLFNLDSVAASIPSKIKYRRVQIVLEEIELYFHPEMQRNYIRFLRQSIRRIELESIQDISICFVTHSPFILSDIPDANILFLQIKDGKAEQVNRFRKTFAANIHDLLADAFFMQDGVCGAYAIECINKTIAFLNAVHEIRLLREQLETVHDQENLLDRIESLETDISGEIPNNHALLIQNIGEPVLKIKLSEMYDMAFPLSREEQILAEIARLQQLLPSSKS